VSVSRRVSKKAIPPRARLPEVRGDDIEVPLLVHPPLAAVCKHGSGDCDVCGTWDLTDRPHSTVGGRGIVARLRRR